MDKKDSEVRQSEQSKAIEDYLSFARHELRGQLSIIHEGISQVLDGLGNGKCERCFSILRIVQDSSDKLNKLIKIMVNLPAIHASLKSKDIIEGLNESEKQAIEILKKETIHLISHAARTPLAVAKEGLALVLEGKTGSLNPEQEKLIKVASENIDRLTDAIKEILDMSWEKMIYSDRTNK